jgi:hydrogenase expression/formation protein HypD
MEALLSSESNRVQAFLAAGHVCTVMGFEEYVPLAKKYRVPIVVTGFEPVDILQGIAMAVKQLEEGRAEVENEYTRSVRREGNVPAQQLIREIFEITNRKWRGIGEIPASGLGIRVEYAEFDAEKIFDVQNISADESKVCIAGVILRGLKKPHECPAFGTDCSPEHPLGAPMVSSEGACAAYYQYRRFSAESKEVREL